MLVKPIVRDPNGQMRELTQSDVLCTMQIMPAANSGTAVTLTGDLLARGIFLSSAASAPTLTLDSAANIVAALAPYFANNVNAAQPNGTLTYQAVPERTSFEYKIVISTANAVTVNATANTGVTVNRGSVPASSGRSFLVTIVNGTPVQTFVCASTNGSAVLSGLTQEQIAKLSVGMVVTNAVVNLQGQTIIGLNATAGTVTMSGNANATSAAASVTFSPVITVDGLE